MSRSHVITKLLSLNDTGETGGHQAGILVPKQKDILGFFPVLDTSTKNPRQTLVFTERSQSQRWEFEFIYYNNKFFDGTRNEFRLTGMTRYFRENNLKAGDTLIFSRDENGKRWLEHKRRSEPETSGSRIKLGSSWKVISI
jgi:hypothetical protein